jgi:hypothetical protein
VLAAEDRAGAGRLGLDEGEVVDDGARAAVAREFADGHRGGDRGRGDRFAALVDDEAPVGVAVEGEAVEGEAEVRALFTDALLDHEVRRVQGVGLVVGEGAVELEVQGYEGEGQAFEDGGDGVAAHAVARVDDDLEGADSGQVDECAQVCRVVVQRIGTGDRSPPRAGVLAGFVADVRAGVRPVHDEFAALGETGVLADRGRARAAQLAAVAAGRVVRGREHRAGRVERTRGVIELVRGAQADLCDVDSAGGRASGEGVGEAG